MAPNMVAQQNGPDAEVWIFLAHPACHREKIAALFSTAMILSGCFIGSDRPLMSNPSPIPTGEFSLYQQTGPNDCKATGGKPPLHIHTGETLCHLSDVSIAQSGDVYRVTAAAAPEKSFAVRLFRFNRPITLIELRQYDGDNLPNITDYFISHVPVEDFGGIALDIVDFDCSDPLLRDAMPPNSGWTGTLLRGQRR